MTDHADERIALFIDGANLYSASRGLGFNIDFKRLLDHFGAQGRLVRAFYYTALFDEMEYSPLRPLIDWLDYNGYGEGFELGMDCPNDRYVNDEAICQAIVSMLAGIGIQVKLNAQPKARFFPKLRPPGLDTSFHLLGWTPPSFDSWNALFNLHGCPRVGDAGAIWPRGGRDRVSRGRTNYGGYCNPKVDALTARILSETDRDRRAGLIREEWSITIEDLAYIPLHQQALAWGVRSGVAVPQRPDNRFAWRHVRMK